MHARRVPGSKAGLAAGLLLVLGAEVHAQGSWDAILSIDPYPSPYYSDWDANPNIASLTLINPTSSGARVRIHFNVTDRRNRVILTGVSEPQAVPASATVLFESPYDVAGSTHHDAEIEEQAARTGRLPEGDYVACTSAADEAGFVLAEACAPFTIVYPDPPLLLGPLDGEVVEQQDPLFLWTPVQVPADYQPSYVLRLVEVLASQSPAEALRSNIPHYQALDAAFTNLRYPIDARPFEPGKRYAWWVQALDQHGYAASANDGRSEVWTFTYQDGPGETPPSSATRIALDVRNVDESTEDFAALWSPEDTTTGLGKICSTWGEPVRFERVVLPLIAEIAFPQVATAPAAILVRDTLDDGRRAWAVTGPAGPFVLLVSGGCAGTATVPRWVGIRKAGHTQELADWLARGDTAISADTSSTKLEFGVTILSLFEENAGEGALDPVHVFLEGREIEVKPGINVFGVLDARQLPELWDWLSAAYDDDEHEIELQGFLGLKQTMAVTTGIGFGPESRSGADATLQQERLLLRGALPWKQFSGGRIERLRGGLEFTFGDSLGVVLQGRNETSGSFDFIPKLFLEIVDTSGITWTGAAELTLGIAAVSGERSAKGTLRLTTDHQWQPGPLQGSTFALGSPEVFLDVNEGLLNAIRSRSGRQIDWDLTARGSLLWRDEDVARASLTVGRKADKPKEHWEGQLARSRAELAAEERRLQELKDRRDAVEDRGDEVLPGSPLLEQIAALERTVQAKHAQVRSDSLVTDLYQKRYDQGNRRANMPAERGRWFWQFTLAFGNMGFGQLFDLINGLAQGDR